jgi:hypothetical protein
MLAMALPPAPPTPITLIRGRSSSTSGRMKSMLMRYLPCDKRRDGASRLTFCTMRFCRASKKLTRIFWA